MKLLVFSDIHNDVRALERLLETEADYYFAAGDMLTWAKGADKLGPVLARRAERLYIIPGNHESESDIEALCKTYGLQPFHGRTLDIAGYKVAGLGYSNITPFSTPESTARLSLLNAWSPLQRWSHWCSSVTALRLKLSWIASSQGCTVAAAPSATLSIGSSRSTSSAVISMKLRA